MNTCECNKEHCSKYTVRGCGNPLYNVYSWSCCCPCDHHGGGGGDQDLSEYLKKTEAAEIYATKVALAELAAKVDELEPGGSEDSVRWDDVDTKSLSFSDRKVPSSNLLKSVLGGYVENGETPVESSGNPYMLADMLEDMSNEVALSALDFDPAQDSAPIRNLINGYINAQNSAYTDGLPSLIEDITSIPKNSIFDGTIYSSSTPVVPNQGQLFVKPNTESALIVASSYDTDNGMGYYGFPIHLNTGDTISIDLTDDVAEAQVVVTTDPSKGLSDSATKAYDDFFVEYTSDSDQYVYAAVKSTTRNVQITVTIDRFRAIDKSYDAYMYTSDHDDTQHTVDLIKVADSSCISYAKDQLLSQNQKTTALNNIGAQIQLISGSTIKTVNGESLLGSGDITISSGSGTISIDDAMDGTSSNPVTNAAYIAKTSIDTASLSNDDTKVPSSKLVNTALGGYVANTVVNASEDPDYKVSDLIGDVENELQGCGYRLGLDIYPVHKIIDYYTHYSDSTYNDFLAFVRAAVPAISGYTDLASTVSSLNGFKGTIQADTLGSTTAEQYYEDMIMNGTPSLKDRIQNLEGFHKYVNCSTSSGVAAKTVTVPGFTLSTGAILFIKMQYKNTSNSAVKLNVNSTGEIALYYNNLPVSSSNTWNAGDIVQVFYDGSYWRAFSVTVEQELDENSCNAVSCKAVAQELYNVNSTIDDLGASITSLEGDLDDKQDVLVSGQNIATINNQSLLNGGNITISGGTSYKPQYLTCSTSGSTATKAVSLSGYTLQTGDMLYIKMTYKNTTSSVKLNVNSTGAKTMYYNGAVVTSNNTWGAGDILCATYDGSYWRTYSVMVDSTLPEANYMTTHLVTSKTLYDQVSVINQNTESIGQDVQNLQAFVGLTGSLQAAKTFMTNHANSNSVAIPNGTHWTVWDGDTYSCYVILECTNAGMPYNYMVPTEQTSTHAHYYCMIPITTGSPINWS